MVTAYDVASIRCAEAEIASGSYTASSTVRNTNAPCVATGNVSETGEFSSLFDLFPILAP